MFGLIFYNIRRFYTFDSSTELITVFVVYFLKYETLVVQKQILTFEMR